MLQYRRALADEVPLNLSVHEHPAHATAFIPELLHHVSERLQDRDIFGTSHSNRPCRLPHWSLHVDRSRDDDPTRPTRRFRFFHFRSARLAKRSPGNSQTHLRPKNPSIHVIMHHSPETVVFLITNLNKSDHFTAIDNRGEVHARSHRRRF
jgi:hypothetical protein